MTGTPPHDWSMDNVRWMDAERNRMSGLPIVSIAPQTVAFLDHLTAMQRVIDAARVVSVEGVYASSMEALEIALVELDGTGGDAA